MKERAFFKKYVDDDGAVNPDVLDLEVDLLGISWLPIPNTVIEPDDWELFWKLWKQEKIASSPQDYKSVAWDTLCIWKSPDLTEEDVQKIYPQRIVDWEKHFPKMLAEIKALMPYEKIWKITLASNTKRIPSHVDAPLNPKYQILHPWPNSVRILLYDENPKDTFYLTRWPEKILNKGKIQNLQDMSEWGILEEPPNADKSYVRLPIHSNAFIYANGPFLHGADYHGKTKILVLIWGRPDSQKWKQKLKELKEDFPQYRDQCCFND